MEPAARTSPRRIAVSGPVLIGFTVVLIAAIAITAWLTARTVSSSVFGRSPEADADYYLPRNPAFHGSRFEERGRMLEAAAPGAGWSFIAYGDHRSSGGDMAPQLRHGRVAAGMIGFMRERQRQSRLDYDFIVTTGDLAKDDLGGDWEAFYRIRDMFPPALPYVVARADHDSHEGYYRRIHDPMPDSDGGERWYWSVLYRGLLLIGLDCSDKFKPAIGEGGAQFNFTIAELEKHPGIPALIFCHKPPYTTGHHQASANSRALDEKLRRDYPGRVRAWICGDNHSYERLLSPPDASGHRTAYIILGGGGAPLRPQDHKDALPTGFVSECWAMVHNFVTVEVLAGRLDVRPYTVDAGKSPGAVTAGIDGVRTPGGEKVKESEFTVSLR